MLENVNGKVFILCGPCKLLKIGLIKLTCFKAIANLNSYLPNRLCLAPANLRITCIKSFFSTSGHWQGKKKNSVYANCQSKKLLIRISPEVRISTSGSEGNTGPSFWSLIVSKWFVNKSSVMSCGLPSRTDLLTID